MEKTIDEKLNEIVSDFELDKVWEHANFGENIVKRELLKKALLQYACDYISGRTILAITIELGLATNKYKLTRKGARYLYIACDTSKTSMI